MKKYVIIVAGGKGNRFNSEIPKQFVKLIDKPVLMHTILAFYHYQVDIQIILVLPQDQILYWKQLCDDYKFFINHMIVIGGETRFHSVKNGLQQVEKACLVAIHDGVRPLIDSETIETCYLEAAAFGNAIPCIELVDSVREILKDGKNFITDRTKLRLIQTPQVFQSDLILRAFEQEYQTFFTDDASVLESVLPNTIRLVNGKRQNIKITTSEDLKYAEAILMSKPEQNKQVDDIT
jgi:2-C-methyl-D-erythritol 4-phosphate cytidylyltransferase